MLGKLVAPRWRLPVVVLFVCNVLSGCAVRKDLAADDDGLPIPLVKMALFKIPLNGESQGALIHDLSPEERFSGNTVQVSHTPRW